MVSVGVREVSYGAATAAASIARIMRQEMYGHLSMIRSSWGTSMMTPELMLNQS